MNSLTIERGDSGQVIFRGEIEGFSHTCTIDGKIAATLNDEQVAALAESLMAEAYSRFINEQQ